MKTTYTLKDFNFEFDESLIAHTPAHPRDHARLLVYNRATKEITDSVFYKLNEFLPPETTLVVNNSKVEKARMLFGKKEVFVVQVMNNKTVEAMVRPGKKFKLGTTVDLADGISARVQAIQPDGLRVLEFNMNLDSPELDHFKLTPFPPYIHADESLAEEYQTVYAKPLGSKAAPTAGLHFTDELISSLKENRHSFEEVTLHVGLGTFAPVKTEHLDEHIMHSEHFIVQADVAARLAKTKHITAVGTTSVRVLESSFNTKKQPERLEGDTDIFITPGYSFKRVDSLITNFHLPESTLLMLVSAFMGYDEMMRVYKHAIKERYRFFSFGDAMLIV
ncbi:tRNA preQ1(34) S-adenosylmethionine ribosyltransferase-isomerase QueA [bacterium]|nr:MAG: tRNA preQ1(34) S-adenosylmethionine ribosyltransferase-isomerase QueA [bacterium]